MYGWPPGYNKANSAVLLRQLVPQHVLPPPQPATAAAALPLLAPFAVSPISNPPDSSPPLSLSLCFLSSPLRHVFFHALQQPNIFIRPLGGVAHVRLLKRFHPEEQPHTSFPPSLPAFISPLFFFLQLPRTTRLSPFFSLSRKEKSRTQHVRRWSFEYPRQRFAIRRNEPESRI